MLPIALIATVALTPTTAFEITSNKPFVQASIDGSAPQWSSSTPAAAEIR